MATSPDFPQFRSIVLDCLDPRGLADFYSAMFGIPDLAVPGEFDDDWIVLQQPDSGLRLAFQRVPALPESSWPSAEIPQQLHLDFLVTSRRELDRHHERAMALGARLLLEETEDDDEEAIRIYADPAGHPFCLFTLPPRPAGGA